MQSKQKLLVFPTSRSIRSYIQEYRQTNRLLPMTLSIDEFFKKSILLQNKKLIDEEQRFLFLTEAIKDIDISKLGISNEFTKFLKQNEYIYRFILELSSEGVDLESISSFDTYDFYEEHLEILKLIHKKYLNILDENQCVDKINLTNNYKINNKFLDKLTSIELEFEGYFTKQEFDIVKEVSKNIDLAINFYSNKYNQKSIKKFVDYIGYEFKENYKYKIDLSSKKVLEEIKIESKLINYDLKSFNSRVNQIAFIKESIVKSINEGHDASKIVIVLPDEKFAEQLNLFDDENYFNYAMGNSIKQSKLFQVSLAINNALVNDEDKSGVNLEFLKIDLEFFEKTIKSNWNKKLTKELFLSVVEYLKNSETNQDIVEKFDEIIYKLQYLFFSTTNIILLKDMYKILLQKISSITTDDINSGKITVMGLLETRNTNYDVVIIPDFNESFIPKKSVKDKFLSTKIKQAVNLPTSQDRESLQKYYYHRLINSSKKVYISYTHNDTNQISRFANDLFDIKNENIEDNRYKHILYNNHKISYKDEEVIENIDLTKFVWSATSLKIFLQCKRKFYLQYISKLKEHTISVKPKGYELGDIIHKVLEKFYKKQNEFTYENLEKVFNEFRVDNSFLVLDLEIWRKKLKDFYEFDKKRLENRSILDLEKPFDIEFDGFKLKGVIDRIDKINDEYEVIDYKTSSSLKVDSARNYEKSNDFQLEFYYLAMSELYKTDKVKSFYYDLYNLKLIEEVTLDKKLELLVEKFNELRELSKDKINFEKCEEKTNCIFCAYAVICNRE